MSPDGKQYFFVAYDYDTNYIFALPIANVQDKTIIEAFDKIFTELTEKGHKPRLNATDNQAVTPLKKYLCAQNCRWKFVEPANHRVNAAERTIQTFKNTSSVVCDPQTAHGPQNYGISWQTKLQPH